MQIKANQKSLLNHCTIIAGGINPNLNFNQPQKPTFPAIDVYEGYDPITKRNQKRYAKVEIFKFKAYPKGIDYLSNDIWRENIQTIIKVSKTLEVKDINISTKKESIWKLESETTRYYISTTGLLSAKEFNELIREHWEIENSNHGIRDNNLEEDKSRIRKNAGAIARIRSFIINILSLTEENDNIRQTLKSNSWSNNLFKKYKMLW